MPPPVALSVTEVFVQVSWVAELLIPTIGAVVFWEMFKLEVAEQPEAFVTVNVYIPGFITVKLALVPTTLDPLLQE